MKSSLKKSNVVIAASVLCVLMLVAESSAAQAAPLSAKGGGAGPRAAIAQSCPVLASTALRILTPSSFSALTSFPIDYSGTAPAGSIIQLTSNDVPVSAPVTVASDGTWSVQQIRSEVPVKGAHAITAINTLWDGSTARRSVRFSLDPSEATAYLTSPKIGSSFPASGAVLTGKGTPGSIAVISAGNDPTPQEVAIDTSGNWTLELPAVVDGPYPVLIQAIKNPGGTPVGGILEVFSPEPPAAPSPVFAITSPNSGDTVAPAGVEVIGQAPANTCVTITDDASGTNLGETVAEANGDWALELPELAEGEVSLSVAATPAVGGPTSTDTLTLTVVAIPVIDFKNKETGYSVSSGSSLVDTGSHLVTAQLRDQNGQPFSGQAAALLGSTTASLGAGSITAFTETAPGVYTAKVTSTVPGDKPILVSYEKTDWAPSGNNIAAFIEHAIVPDPDKKPITPAPSKPAAPDAGGTAPGGSGAAAGGLAVTGGSPAAPITLSLLAALSVALGAVLTVRRKTRT